MQAEAVAPQLGEESTIHALGQDWKVGRLTIDVWDKLLEWAKPRIVSPLEVLRNSGVLKDLPPEVAVQVIAEARRECPTVLSITHPLFHAAVNSLEGQIHQYWLMLQKNHPDITEDTVAQIMEEIGDRKREDTVARASGSPPPLVKKKDPSA